MEEDKEKQKDMDSGEEKAEKIARMFEDGRRLIEEARREARELKRRSARERRGRGHRSRSRRKEKILNIRIGRDLEEKLKAEADRSDTPVSKLVRNILEDTFELVDNIGANVEDLVGDVVDEAQNIAGIFMGSRGKRRDDVVDEEIDRDDEREKPDTVDIMDDVLAWQDVTMGRAVACAGCGADIARGDKGNMGISERTGARVFLCPSCIGVNKETGTNE